MSSIGIGQTGIFGKDPQCNMQLHNVACQRCTVLCTGFFLRQCACLGDGCLSRRARRTLVKRNVKTGALAFDSGVLSKMLEKRGVAPPLSEAAAAAWDDHLAGQLLPADALEYLQVPDSHVAPVYQLHICVLADRTARALSPPVYLAGPATACAIMHALYATK